MKCNLVNLPYYWTCGLEWEEAKSAHLYVELFILILKGWTFQHSADVRILISTDQGVLLLLPSLVLNDGVNSKKDDLVLQHVQSHN